MIEPTATPRGETEVEEGSGDSATIDNTTLVVLVTDALLDLITAKKLAQSCMTGLTDVVYPACTIFDGDLSIAVSIGHVQEDLTHLCLMAQSLVSDAIISGVNAATAAGAVPSVRSFKDSGLP